MNSTELLNDLLLQTVILRDGLAIERELARMRERRIEIEVPIMCGRCNRVAAHCVCGLWSDVCGAEPTILREGEHDKFPQGRAQSLQP